MDICETERGNNAFSNSEGSAVIFIEQEIEGKYLQIGYTPMNYPSWDVSTIYLYNEELADHIAYNLGGWHVDKCQFPINIDCENLVIAADDVVDDVANHVMSIAYEGEFDPTQTQGALEDAIDDSARVMEYILTEKMRKECYDIIMENFEN